MLKAQYDTRGPVPHELIQANEFDTPDLKPGEVLLELLAAPINPSDVLTLTGEYGILPPLPAIGGNEGVAKVIKHGPDVTAPAIGQTVLLPVGIGTWATHIVATADKLIPLPNEADPQQLSMITVNPPTASLLLSEFIDLQPGDWVVQNAANSGVGYYLIQLAKMRGIKTVNIVRRESLIQPLKDAGADVVVVDSKGMHKEIKKQTDGANIQLGIDAVGGMATNQLTMLVGEGGTVINYGLMSGEACVVSPTAFVFKDITLKGFWLAKWFRTATIEQQQKLYGELTHLIVAGKLHAPIHATFSVKDIKDAVKLATQESRDGKVLVTQ